MPIDIQEAKRQRPSSNNRPSSSNTQNQKFDEPLFSTNPLPPVQSSYSVLSKNQNYQQNQIVTEDLIRYNHITYALAVFSYFTAGLMWVIPIVMNYARRDEARHTWLYSHFDWQIKTFWYSVFFGGIGIILMLFGFGTAFLGMLMQNDTLLGSSGLAGIFGLLIFIVVIIWHFYRMVRGWVALNNRRAVP